MSRKLYILLSIFLLIWNNAIFPSVDATQSTRCTKLLRNPTSSSSVLAKTAAAKMNINHRQPKVGKNPSKPLKKLQTKLLKSSLSRQLRRNCKRALKCCHKQCRNDVFSVTCSYPTVQCQCGSVLI